MAADPRSPLDHALDLVVFAPVGLVLTAKDELPGLIEKGRQRLGSQVLVAKMVGQFAAAQGQRVAARLVDQVTVATGRIGGLPPTATAPRPGSASPSAPTNGNGREGGSERGGAASSARTAGSVSGRVRSGGSSGGSGSGPVGGSSAGPVGGSSGSPRRATAVPPTVDTLAIPGYDSLAASQVVQRLAGLSAPELEAVRRYELATRGRRTILSKVAQLEAERSPSPPARRP